MRRKIPKQLADIILHLPKEEQPEKKSKPLLAISGGRDSMLLLYLFLDLHQKGYVPKPIVFHLEHKLQEASQKGFQLVQKQCEKLDIPLYYQEKNVKLFSKRLGKSLEEAGRILRYRLLARLANKFQPTYGVTAHHANDYLESLLLHLIRGGGESSLKTLPIWSYVEKTLFFRPLIQFSRSQVTEIVTKYKIPYYDDPSNDSMDFLRNRLRKHICPELEKEGMNVVNLWKNFHKETQIHFVQSTNQNTQKYLKRNIDYLSIERRWLGGSLSLKKLFDMAFLRLGLEPAHRNFLKEIQTQIGEKIDFRIYYESKQFYLWSDRRGPIWLFSKKAMALRPFQVRKTLQGFTLKYNHAIHSLQLKENEKLLSFQDGMKVQLKSGTKKVKKIFQESAIPIPVRKNLPLIWDENTQKIICIFFSFWENKKDRFF